MFSYIYAFSVVFELSSLPSSHQMNIAFTWPIASQQGLTLHCKSRTLCCVAYKFDDCNLQDGLTCPFGFTFQCWGDVRIGPVTLTVTHCDCDQGTMQHNSNEKTGQVHSSADKVFF